VWLPYEQAEAASPRRSRPVAGSTGGRMVGDAFTPSWWTLADGAGNEVGIATTRP
jgi:hypothetical protein